MRVLFITDMDCRRVQHVTVSQVAVSARLAIALTIFSLNVLGDGLRDALDPKLRQ